MARNGLTKQDGKSRRRALYALAAALLCALVLYRFPPERYGFYPRCPVYALTGWECPGCGMTRALAALVRGNLGEAVRWNPLVLAVVAGFAGWVGAMFQGVPRVWVNVRGPLVSGLLLLAAVLMVVRNLPR